MLLLIDNNKNHFGIMTHKIINYLALKKIPFLVESSLDKIKNILNQRIKIIGIILSGSSYCLSSKINVGNINKNFLVMLKCQQIPILGICFGFQIICLAYGGEITKMINAVKGKQKISLLRPCPLFTNLENLQEVFLSHKDCLEKMPLNFEIIATNLESNVIQAIQSVEDLRWGLQFHPEALVDTCPILFNFYELCKNISLNNFPQKRSRITETNR